MGWTTRIVAALVGLGCLALGLWPVGLLALVYLVYSFRRPNARVVPRREDVLARRRRPWGRYLVGSFLLGLAVIAAGQGGTFSPIVFLVLGLAAVFWPRIRGSGLFRGIRPVKDSVLLRSIVFPFRWHALAEVKLESEGQVRGVAALDGRLLVFSGKTPSAYKVVSVHALGFKDAEEKVVRILRRDTRMLSQRGAHLLPLDSIDAGKKLSLTLDRLEISSKDLDGLSSLPFDLFSLKTKEGLLVGHRAFRIVEPSGPARIPASDDSTARLPLFAEVVEEVGERHGWPAPDEFSSFLAAMDASRSEPLVDRLRTLGEVDGRVRVETPGGPEVGITRAQLRAVARIYA